MKSMLVTFSFQTRVVVPDDANEEQISDMAIQNMRIRLDTDLLAEFKDNEVKQEQDLDCPFDPEFDQ